MLHPPLFFSGNEESVIAKIISTAPIAKLRVSVSRPDIRETTPVITAESGFEIATNVGLMFLRASVLKSQQTPTEKSENRAAGISILTSK